MIISKISLGLFCFLLLVHSSVYAIYDPNDGAKTSHGYTAGPRRSEPLVMHHSYSQVASNRPAQQETTRSGRTSTIYTSETENHVAQHGLRCPRNATGQYPYLLNCRQFLNCWKGRGYIQSCAPGTAFNPDTRECDNPEKVVCMNYRRESKTNDKQFARLQQESGDNFDYSQSVAIGSNGNSLSNSGDTKSVKCDPHKSGLQPHPFDCSKFLNCDHGRTHVQNCGPGTVFNEYNLVCDFPYNVDCSNRNQISSTVETSEIPDYDTKGLSPGYEESSTATPSSRRHYISISADRPQNSFGNLSPSAEYNRGIEGSSTGSGYRNPHGYNHQHNSRHHEHHQTTHHQPQTGWQYTDSSSFRPGHNYRQQGTNSAGGWRQYPVQGNRDPKSNWGQQTSEHSPPENPSSPDDSYNIEQAQVHQMPNFGTLDSANKNIFQEQTPELDDDGYDGNQQQQVKEPSKFLEPPKSTNQQTSNKTVIYYAQPVAVYDPNDPNHRNNADRKPVWKPITGITPLDNNRTVTVYYATPVRTEKSFESYEPQINNEQGVNAFLEDPVPEQQTLTDFLIPPNINQNSSWDSVGVQTPSTRKWGNQPPSIGWTQPARSDDKLHRNLPPTPVEPLVPVPFGDLLPPLIDIRTTNRPTVPSLVLSPPATPTKPLQTSVLYSSPYAGVAHSKVPQANIPDTSIEEQFEAKRVVPIYVRPNTLHSSTMSDKKPIHNPPPFNHDYYNPPEAQIAHSFTTESSKPQTSVEPTALPISEALKMLLRPYFNRSGTVTDDVVSQMDQHIMSISKGNTKSTIKTQLTTTKQPPTRSEAEIIFTGEQANMNHGTQQHHLDDTSLENSNENSTHESLNPTGWHHRHHRHHFHQNHATNHSNCNHTHHNHHHHHYHGHHWNHRNRTFHHTQEFHRNNRTFQHNQEFHRNHPNIPNPFVNNDLGHGESADPKQGTIDPRVDLTPDEFYPGLDADKPACQFNCNNGKCIREYQVCDGVNDCGNRLDEKQCDHIGYEVRLSSEEGKANMGRVEVKVKGQWGYVCDDKFGMRAADVLCRELGFTLGASEVRGNSYYQPNKQMYDEFGVRYLMDEVDCMGNETSIRECNFKGWGVHDCSPDEVVGVVCKIPVMTCPPNYWLCKTSQECVAIGFLCDSVLDCQDGSDESREICNETIQYRLKDGPTDMEGRVEVKYRDTWGTICDDDFGIKEAQVICRTLGYLGEATVLKNAYGSGDGPIWLDQVSCIGNETNLEQCSHWAWGEHNCDHKEDVSVRCSERVINPRAEVTTSTTENPGIGQIPEEDIDLYLYKVQRASKAMNQNKRCGQINEHVIDEFDTNLEFARVVNGTKALRGHHPWQASLRAKGRNGMSTHWCGAILITQMHVLTAAHCLIGYQKEALFVRLGDHYSKIAEPSEIDSFIQNWYVHEEFRKGHHMNNDIGLIVLKNPVIFNDYIQPICLPSKDAQYEQGRQCTISGWGSIKSGISNPAPSNNLKAAHVPLISQAMCKEPYVYGNAITDNMFCAGYLDEGVDACDGDSGGPLACSTPDGETLYGIISWGQHCGQANKPGVYVKVSNYLDWIMTKIMLSMKSKSNE